jgi:hypothetical protein
LSILNETLKRGGADTSRGRTDVDEPLQSNKQANLIGHNYYQRRMEHASTSGAARNGNCDAPARKVHVS